MRLVVTGVPGAGTAYIARVLTACGVECGHERVFNQASVLDGCVGEEAVPAESSAFAVPLLGRLAPVTVVVHQTRDPWAWLRSFVPALYETATDPVRYALRRRFLERFAPDALIPDAVRGALRFWVRWNAAAERGASLRYRLEDVAAGLVEALGRLADLETRASARAIEAVPTTTNAKRKWAPLSPADLPRAPEADQFTECAERFGYGGP